MNPALAVILLRRGHERSLPVVVAGAPVSAFSLAGTNIRRVLTDESTGAPSYVAVDWGESRPENAGSSPEAAFRIAIKGRKLILPEGSKRFPVIVSVDRGDKYVWARAHRTPIRAMRRARSP